jgi:FlaG/FlaF family flagellin (archaellin)
MKGISDIIAMLLMLIITIAIAGLAYGFISGVFTSRTAAVLSVDIGSYCNNTHVIASVRNDGTSPISTVTVTVLNATRTQSGTCSISNLAAGTLGTCAATRSGSGIHTIIATGGGSSAQGTVYCS